MDTQLLSAFIAVAKQQSFSIAAKQLGLTQSAVSKRIALLEQQLSTLLFDRVGRSILLTEAGQMLLPRARHILDAVEDTQHFMEQLQGEVSGQLRLATSHHIGIHRLPPILKTYTQQYPKVHLQLHFIDSEQANNAIRQGEFDMAVITLPEPTHDDGSNPLQQHTLWQDPMHIVVNHQHPLRHKKHLQLRHLSEHPAILPDRTTRTTTLIQRAFIEGDSELNITMTSNHLDAIKMMVSVGLGWSALPERLIDNNLYKLSLKKLSLTRELGCIHHRHRTLSSAARAMLACLLNE